MQVFLFDFDGVILDTLETAVEVYNLVLRRNGINKQFTSTEFTNLFLENYHNGLAEIIPDNAMREKVLVERAEEYIKRKEQLEMFDGIETTLRELANYGEIVIISSNRTNFIRAFLKDRNMNYVKDVIGGDIEKSKVKKINWHKEKYPGSEIYYIGDTRGDIREGKAAKVITIAASWGFHSAEQLRMEEPDFLVEKPSELLSILG